MEGGGWRGVDGGGVCAAIGETVKLFLTSGLHSVDYVSQSRRSDGLRQ